MVESKHQWKAWLYLAPAIILLLVFTVWPIINTVSMAFQEGYDYSNIKKLEAYNEMNGTNLKLDMPIGLGNFKSVLDYEEFGTVLGNTMILCVATVPISTILALLIAVALNSIKPLQKVLQTIYFLPYVTNSIAIGMVFYAMFNMIGLGPDGSVQEMTSVGIVNTVIRAFGGDPINWVNAG